MPLALTAPHLDRIPRPQGRGPDRNPFVMRRWVAPIAWALLILSLTSIPGPTLPPVPVFPHADKLAHLALYGVFGALATRSALRGRIDAHGWRPGAFVATLVVIALFALADEWHQEYIPGRSADPTDWVADVLGASGGIAAARWTLRNREQTS
jgi:VanZ family protein